MMKGLLANRKAFSPIIATIILCAAVLAVGMSLWSFTYSVSNSLQTSYFNEVKAEVEVISERFTVEHVSYDHDTSIFYVWVYNYGEVNIEVDVYVYIEGELLGKNVTATSIPSTEFLDVRVSPITVSEGSSILIEAISRRQNVLYETYVVTAR